MLHPTAIAIATAMLDAQRGEKVLHSDRRMLASLRAEGHWISRDVDAELDARAAVVETMAAACRYHLRRIPAANDHCSAPSAA